MFVALMMSLNCFVVLSQKNVRDYVVIVKPVYHESTTQFLKKLSKYAESKGYLVAANHLNTFAEGKGFGSGFLVKGADDKTYIVTNRHVILQAEKVTVEMLNPDGGRIVYNDCNIVAIDANSDLALLSLREDININKSLSLKSQPVEDGQDVFTAAFPV